MYDESIANPDKFWGDQARKFLKWMTMFKEVNGCKKEEGIIKWFSGGQLNVTSKPIIHFSYSICF